MVLQVCAGRLSPDFFRLMSNFCVTLLLLSHFQMYDFTQDGDYPFFSEAPFRNEVG